MGETKHSESIESGARSDNYSFEADDLGDVDGELENDNEINFDHYVRRLIEKTSQEEPLIDRKSIYFKASRLLLIFLSTLCRVDLLRELSKDAPIVPRAESGQRSRAQGAARGRLASDQRRGWLIWTAAQVPRLIEIFYFMCCLRSVVNVYFQYRYDYYLYQHRHLVSLTAKSSTWGLMLNAEAVYVNATINLLERRVNSTRAQVRALGAPFINLSYFVEIAYEYLVCLSYMAFFAGRRIFASAYYSLYCRFARIILDEEQEKYGHLRLVHREVNKFIVSSRNFTRIATAGHNVLYNLSDSRQSSANRPRRPPSNANERIYAIESLNNNLLSKRLRKLLMDQRFNVRQLKQMAFSDSLKPLNLTSDWMNKLTYYHYSFSLALSIYGSLLLGVTVVVVIILCDFNFTFQPLDYYGAFESAFEGTCLITGMIFYVALVFISAIDQISYANRLRCLIELCLCQNQIWLAEIGGQQATVADNYYAQQTKSASSTPPPSADTKFSYGQSMVRLTAESSIINNLKLSFDDNELDSLLSLNRVESSYRKMNSNLLYCFMHYKIYAAQAQLERRCYGVFALITIIIFLSLPIMARLHEPYVMWEAKLLQFGICAATGVFLNAVLIPISYLNGRSIDLYKTMCRLLAHTIETANQSSWLVDSHSGLKIISNSSTVQIVGSNSKISVNPVYNLHLVWLLRKELSNPDMFVKQFATISWGIQFDYSNLIKLHFWCGIILLSLVGGFTSGPDAFFGGFLSDPFGIYQMDDLF